MSRIFILLFITVICSCNDISNRTTESTESVSEAGDLAESKLVLDQMDKLLNEKYDSIEVFINDYSAKEVYFEIVRRQIEEVPDTLPYKMKDTLPSIITLNYTKDEINSTKSKVTALASLSNLELLSLYQNVMKGRKVIYGYDDRQPVVYDTVNIERVTDEDNQFMNDGKSVVAIIPKAYLTKNTSTGNYVLRPKGSFKDVYKLCSTERFLDDPVVANCSGFSVDTNIIVTAGHCITSQNYRGFYFVYDFITDGAGNYNKNIPARNVYEAKRVLARSLSTSASEDFAVIEVNRSIDRARIAKVSTVDSVYDASTLFHVIGSPCGTPLKLALNANIRSASHSKYFTITSDTYGGNSGSPVFNSETHMVEGILVRGNDDFRLSLPVENIQCRVSIVCPFDGCNGEDVSRNSQYLQYLKNR